MAPVAQPGTFTEYKDVSMTTRLRQFIEQESGAMQKTLRFFLVRAGLSDGLEDAASELWNEVVVEALKQEGRFRAGAQPRPWLVGIAVNLIKRRKVESLRRRWREPLVRDLYPEDELSDDELFDRVAEMNTLSAEMETESAAYGAMKTLMAALSAEDQRVLSLAVVHNMDGKALADELGTTPGTARVRLHRALTRLRTAYEQARNDDEALR
ncbi:MAG: sigma-70 family RNA polymerase sigma factor [bacterium]|nr:sigma-70 family RNA polymerase sigma factor [bacterium]